MIIPSRRLSEIEEKIKKIENLLVLSQITKNKKLILLSLEETEKVIKELIEINPGNNFLISKREIKEIFEISEHHKKSEMEFLRNNEVIILSENQEIRRISPQKLTEFLKLAKMQIQRLNEFQR